MTHLILIRHANTVQNPAQPSHLWPLSEKGKARCYPLAKALRAHDIQQIITSSEPKAIETGTIVAAELTILVCQHPNLHEHDRQGARWIDDPAQFQSTIRALFANPDQLVFGNETAHQARDRFVAAVAETTAQYPGSTIAIVAHGTVISLLVAHYIDTDPYQLWSTLTMPAYIVLKLPEYSLLTIETFS